MLKKVIACLGIGSLSMATSAQTLQSAIQHAMISNPSLLRSVAENYSAEQGMRQARGAYLPTVDIGLGLGREKTSNPITTSIGGASSDQTLTRYEASIELKQRIFAGFGVEGEVERKQHLWHAQEYRTLGRAEDLSLQITEKYLEVLKQQQLLMLARNNLSDHQQVYNMIKQRSNSGISGAAELAQASGRLALANANIISVRNNLRDARTNFKALVGESPKSLTWPAMPGRGILPPRLIVAIQRGLDNHPTLKSAYADIQEAKAQYKVAKSSDYPNLDLILSASRNRNTDGLIGRNDDNLAVLRLSYNVFRGGSDLARKRETAFQVQEAYEVKNKTINQLKESIHLSWHAWLTAGRRLQYLREHVKSVSIAESSYSEQFKIAKRSLLDLLDSKNETYEAKIELEKGIIDEAYTRFRILNGSGSLLDFLNGLLPAGVHNDDLGTSHENIQHSRFNGSVQSVPKVDLSNRSLRARDLSEHPHLTLSKHQIRETSNHGLRFKANAWYVNFKMPNSEQAIRDLYSRLKRLGMKAFMSSNTRIYLGPFEYRAQAGMAMTRLHNKANVKGSVVYLPKLSRGVKSHPMVMTHAKVATKKTHMAKLTKPLNAVKKSVFVAKNIVNKPRIYGPTTKKDDLWQITLKHKPASASMAQAMLGIIQLNQHAFTDANMNGLKTGVKLRIPSDSSFIRISKQEAKLAIDAQMKAWKHKKKKA